MLNCEFCGIEIDWEGQHHTNGVMWSCEVCGKTVCSKCIEDITHKSVGLSSEIKCPDCIKKEFN